MSNEDVLERSTSQEEESSVGIEDLLEIANSKVFDDQDGLTERKKNFEKVTSFFDLISHLIVKMLTLKNKIKVLRSPQKRP